MQPLTLSDIMVRQVAECTPDCSLGEAARLMASLGISSLMVREGEALLGIVTERDLLLAGKPVAHQDKPVRAIMSAPVLRAPHDMTYCDAYLHAARHRVRHLAVVEDDGKLVGVVTETDFRQHMNLDVLSRLGRVEGLMDRQVPTLSAQDRLGAALGLMGEQNASCVIILEEKLPKGILTTRDVVRIYDRLDETPPVFLGEVMTAPVCSISHQATPVEAAQVMAGLRIRHLAVVDGAGRYMGVISEHDLLRPLEFDELEHLLDDQCEMAATLEEVQAVAGLGSWTLDVPRERLNWSRETYRLFGLQEGTAPTFEICRDCVHPDDRDWVFAAWRQAQAGTPFSIEYRVLRQGEIRWVHEQARFFYDRGGRPSRGVGTVQDITGRKAAESALQDSEARYRTVVDRMTDTLSVIDRDGYIRFANVHSARNLCGGKPEDVVGRNIAEFITSRDAGLFLARYQRVIDSGEPFKGEVNVIMNGRERWFLNRLNPLRLPGSGEVLALSMSLDISGEKEADERLRLAASVFDHAHEGILITDAEQNIVEVNKTFCDLTGYDREEVLGRKPSILNSGQQSPEFFEQMWLELEAKGHWQGEIWNRRKSGELFAELISISAVRSPDGRITNYLGVFSDITETKEHQKELERMAHYDALTQLPNRVLLSDRLQQAMPQALRSGNPLAVCYLDLDGFKEVNDSLGHAAGDRLLLEVSQRLKSSVRSGDTVARLGGDEFILLLRDQRSLAEVIQTLTRVLAILATPYSLFGKEAHVSASIGVTLYPDDEADADTLIRHADQAMYAAKLGGRNRYHMFDPEQDRRAAAHRETVARIRQALRNNEFELYYQPKVDMRRGKVIGMEALIRWRHPERGLLLPGTFLPYLDDNDLSVDLGDWVLNQAMYQAEQWRLQGLDLNVNINIAARHLQQKGFLSRLREHLAAHPRLPAHLLELEILESVALDDMGRVSQVIEDCHELGVRMALDDFGTGYASLTYFRRLPVDTLKVDQSFVRDMLEDEEDYAIVEGVVGLTQAFRRQVVAEGVETSQHGMVLLRMGCDLAQGYGIARPMPANQVPGWIRQFQPDPLWHSGLGYQLGREDIPLMLAEHNHRAWVDAVVSYVESEDPKAMPPACINHMACAFGRWYYGSGQRRYGEFPQFQAMAAIHHAVHEVAAEICQMKVAGSRQEAQSGLARLHALKARLLDTLAELIVAVTEKQQPY